MCQFIPSPVFFFTVRLQDPASDLLVRHVGLLRDAVRLARQRAPFTINAAVVLPNRTHMIWTMPPGDVDFAMRWRIIKDAFSAHVPSPRYQSRAAIARGRAGIWQRRYWENRITSKADFDAYLDIIRQAPVEDGLVKRFADWPYGSFAHALQQNAIA